MKVTLVLLVCAAAASTVRADSDHRPPDLPPGCEKLAPAEDSKVVAHVFATGVQMYRWNGNAWVFFAPAATLFADANHRKQVGTHFGTATGPALRTAASVKG